VIRIWLSRGVTIPVREQLSAQLILGILSGRIAPGERLPSVRELARRLKLHANTISAAYRDLAARGYVSQRRGSGVFVRDLNIANAAGGVDAFVRGWAEQGIARGYSLESMQAALARMRQEAAARRFLVVDPEEAFAEILAAEIGEATGAPPPFASFDTAAPSPGACLLVSDANRARCAELFPGVEIRPIRLRAMQDFLTGRKRPPGPALVAVISRSEAIHRWAATLLSALGFSPDAVVHRDPSEPGWQDGLAACHIVAADVVSAARIPATVFRLVADDFLSELRDLVTAQKLS
jgi:GntR family transcriptional regulator